MARRATTLELRPARTEGWTSLSLSCAVPDSLPPPALYQLLSLLSFWSGQRLDVALDAGGPAGWCEVWADALAAVPERHLRLRFDIGQDVKDDAHEVGLLEQKPRAALTGLPRELDGLGELGSRYFKILAAGTRSMSLRARYVRLRRAVPPAHDP